MTNEERLTALERKMSLLLDSGQQRRDMAATLVDRMKVVEGQVDDLQKTKEMHDVSLRRLYLLMQIMIGDKEMFTKMDAIAERGLNREPGSEITFVDNDDIFMMTSGQQRIAISHLGKLLMILIGDQEKHAAMMSHLKQIEEDVKRDEGFPTYIDGEDKGFDNLVSITTSQDKMLGNIAVIMTLFGKEHFDDCMEKLKSLLHDKDTSVEEVVERMRGESSFDSIVRRIEALESKAK